MVWHRQSGGRDTCVVALIAEEELTAYGSEAGNWETNLTSSTSVFIHSQGITLTIPIISSYYEISPKYPEPE